MMIMAKTLTVLHFEDDKITRFFISEKLKMDFGAAKVTSESSLINIEIYLKTHMIDNFDLLLFDWHMPVYDIEGFLPLIAKCHKPILFYTCLDYDEWAERVTKILGRIPKNFKFARKAQDDITETIRAIL